MQIVMITPDSAMIDRRILLEAKTLTKAGHQVILLAGFECEKEEHYNYEGIEIHRYKYDWDDERLKKIRSILPNNDKLKMFVNRAYMKIARTYFEIDPFDQYMISKLLEFDQADVYHVHDLPCLKAAYHATKKSRVKLVYDAHELYYAQDVLPPSLQKKYFNLEKKYIKYPNVTITVNPFIAGLMSERYNCKKPEVIMNCTELPSHVDLNNSLPLLRKKGNIPDDYKIVLYQGWISSERNIETLVRGVKYFPEKTCLVLIGYGEYEKELKRIAQSEGIEDKVYFLGMVSSDEIMALTVGADLGVIPYQPIDDNHRYCSPNKLFEFALAGLPVITEDLPFFNYMNEKYGFISTTNLSAPDSFGDKVKELISTEVTIASLKRNANNAAKELNWHVEGQKLLKIYKQYIGD